MCHVSGRARQRGTVRTEEGTLSPPGWCWNGVQQPRTFQGVRRGHGTLQVWEGLKQTTGISLAIPFRSRVS